MTARFCSALHKTENERGRVFRRQRLLGCGRICSVPASMSRTDVKSLRFNRRQQRLPLQEVRLRAPRPARHFDTRGVDHQIREAQGREESMRPESLAPRFVATSHGRRRRQAAPQLRGRDRSRHRPPIPRGHPRAVPRPAWRRRHRQPPLPCAQLDRLVERRSWVVLVMSNSFRVSSQKRFNIQPTYRSPYIGSEAESHR